MVIGSVWLLQTGAMAQGKVGINTNMPQAMLHVKDSSVLFSGVNESLPVTPGNPPASGPGARMMWYADKAAFRVGAVTNNNWDKDSVGRYSFASGRNAKAMGSYSVAMGNNTVAMSEGSTSIGNNVEAKGENATAFGYRASATGYSSVAIGRSTIASNYTAVALGNGAEAEGMYSTALGDFTKAIGETSTAIGDQSRATGNYSTAMGSRTRAVGNYSTATGDRTYSKAYSSFSIGRFNDSIATSSPTNWISADPLFIIGNGSDDDNRNNAMVVYKNGNTNVDGEINRTATGAANIVPVCYGSVSGVGVINSGTGNFTVTNPSAGQYEIDIVGQNYTTGGFITNVTVVSGGNFRVATSGATAGNLSIRIFNLSGTLVNDTFHFVVYKQ